MGVKHIVTLLSKCYESTSKDEYINIKKHSKKKCLTECHNTSNN